MTASRRSVLTALVRILVLALATPFGLMLAGTAGADEASRIGFVGNNLFGRADGQFREWRVVEHVVDLSNPSASQAVVEVELASVDTQNERRDEHLRTADFFDVAKFSIATVRGHSARPLEPTKTGHPRYAVQFDVNLHGVDKTIEGELEIAQTEPLIVEGGFMIRRTDFGIGAKPSSWNPMSIDDDVPVRFRIELE